MEGDNVEGDVSRSMPMMIVCHLEARNSDVGAMRPILDAHTVGDLGAQVCRVPPNRDLDRVLGLKVRSTLIAWGLSVPAYDPTKLIGCLSRGVEA